MESNKLFRGRLGHLEERYRDAARQARPGSVPGMLVSRTSAGTLIRPVRNALAQRSKVEEAIVDGVYDDVISVQGTIPRLVAKPYTLRCSPWRGANSWTPAMAFRYWHLFAHPRINVNEKWDYEEVVGTDGSWMRTVVHDRPGTLASLGSYTYTRDPQMIWPEYMTQLSGAQRGETILIQKVKGMAGPTGAVWTLDADITDPLSGGTVIWPAGTPIEWIDLNVDARRWMSIPQIIYQERTFDAAVSGIQDGQVMHWNQD